MTKAKLKTENLHYIGNKESHTKAEEWELSTKPLLQ